MIVSDAISALLNFGSAIDTLSAAGYASNFLDESLADYLASKCEPEPTSREELRATWWATEARLRDRVRITFSARKCIPRDVIRPRHSYVVRHRSRQVRLYLRRRP